MKKTDLSKTENKIIAAIKKPAQNIWNKLKKIKAADIAVVVGVAVMSGIIIIPSIIQCGENRAKSECLSHMYRMIMALSDGLEEEAEAGGTYLQDMITNGNYRNLLTVLNEKTGEADKHPDSDYYIRMTNDRLEIICKKHRDISARELVLSSIKNVNIDISEKTVTGDDILYITVGGPDAYYQDEALDASQPDKMVFTGEEIDSVIGNLNITAVYTGGYTAELPRDSYTVSARSLDMTRPGRTKLIIKTNSNSIWDSSAYASFVLNIIGKDDIAPLIVDAGINGKYELAAWDWQDFVKEASAESGGKSFGASIIRVSDKYYYYPDGLHIINSMPNTTPFEYAYDTDGSTNPAYCIMFDAESVILNSSDAGKIHNGSLKAENDRVYIWQDEASKELAPGWIMVYCDIKKY